MFKPDLYTHPHFSFASSPNPSFPHSFFLSIKSDIIPVYEIKPAAVPQGMRSKRRTACQLQLLVYSYRYLFLTQGSGEQVCTCTYNFTPPRWNLNIFTIKATPDNEMPPSSSQGGRSSNPTPALSVDSAAN